MGHSTVRFKVNGVERESAADPGTPLIHILRNDFGLKGTRFGCGTEQCNACLVLVEGRAVTACTMPLAAADGKAITTVEGLGDEARPHPLQRALLDEQAAQCGYCLSGILVKAAELLERDPGVDEAGVRAVLRAAAEMRARQP